MGILLNISGLIIDFDTRFPDYIRERCRKYLTNDSGNSDNTINIRVSEEDIDTSDVNQVGRKEAELYALSVRLGELLPSRGRILTHGVAISCDGYSYVFTAKSGVGKSTHAFLWQKYFGEDRVKIINGDKPVLWFRDDGEILACGGPWNGKENLDENTCLPLRGICLLRRLGTEADARPEITRASREESLDFLLEQIYLPLTPSAQIRTFSLLEKLYDTVPIYHLSADMSREAVIVSSSILNKF